MWKCIFCHVTEEDGSENLGGHAAVGADKGTPRSAHRLCLQAYHRKQYVRRSIARKQAHSQLQQVELPPEESVTIRNRRILLAVNNGKTPADMSVLYNLPVQYIHALLRKERLKLETEQRTAAQQAAYDKIIRSEEGQLLMSHLAGRTDQELAKEFNYSVKDVKRLRAAAAKKLNFEIHQGRPPIGDESKAIRNEEIRQKASGGVKPSALALEYGISRTMIRNILLHH